MVDVVTFVFELDKNSVVGKDAHAIDLVSVYDFGQFGEMAVFVEHVVRSVKATIMREDQFLLWLYYFGVQSKGVGYQLILIEVHSRSYWRKCYGCLIHVWRRHDG